MGTKKGQVRKTARRAYKGYEVTYNAGGKRFALRRKFKTKSDAKRFVKNVTKKKGANRNPRVRRVR